MAGSGCPWTPVAMLDPGAGKTHRAYLWSYCKTQFDPVKAVVFDFANSRRAAAVEREVQACSAEDRQATRKEQSSKIADALQQWLLQQRCS